MASHAVRQDTPEEDRPSTMNPPQKRAFAALLDNLTATGRKKRQSVTEHDILLYRD
jgi:hypothetical protein